MQATRALILLLGLTLPLVGCREEPFGCESNDQCSNGDDDGTCEANGYCSFGDTSCPSGRRYGSLAGGGLADLCVNDGGTGSTTSSSETSSSSPSTTTTSPATTSAAGADGDRCTDDADCLSNHCYIAGGIGGTCGECSSDEDCDWGCTPPGVAGLQAQGASSCNDGELGGGCQTTTSCQAGLQCTLVYEVAGKYDASGCSSCVEDDDCQEGSVCSPDISLDQSHAHKRCVLAGSLSLGELCDYVTSGDEACGSGYCATAVAMNVFAIGVCSECSNDDDPGQGCDTGQQCIRPQVSLADGSIVHGTCES